MTQVVNGFLAWPFERFEVRVIRSRDGSRGLRALGLFLRALWRIATLPAGRGVVVVHLSQGGSFVREGLLLWLARQRGFGTVAHLHGSSFVPFSQRHPRRVAWVLRAATKVIVLSEATGDAAARSVPQGRIVLLPNAVPPGSPHLKEQLVVFGGGVSRRKGVDVLVEAWRRVGVGRGWHLVVAGPVIDPDVVPADLPDASFPGAVAHDVLMGLLDRSQIAVLPSRDEAMPMFILEALARDNCVVSTRVGGIPAVLGDDRGVLVPPGDTGALATALQAVMDHAELRQRLAAAGREAFEADYAAQSVYPRVEQLWHDVLVHPVP